MNVRENLGVNDSNGDEITVALEGPVCAGKSSLLDGLVRLKWNVIEEYREYLVKANKSFPKFPPCSDSEAKRNFEAVLELEEERFADYKMKKGAFKKTALDRSIFTLLAFEKGSSRLSNINIYHWAIDRVVKSIDVAGIIWPNKVSYLDIPNEVARARANLKNLGTAAFLFEEEFNQGFRESIYDLGRIFKIPIFEIDGTQTKPLVLRQFLDNLHIM